MTPIKFFLPLLLLPVFLAPAQASFFMVVVQLPCQLLGVGCLPLCIPSPAPAPSLAYFPPNQCFPDDIHTQMDFEVPIVVSKAPEVFPEFDFGSPLVSATITISVPRDARSLSSSGLIADLVHINSKFRHNIDNQTQRIQELELLLKEKDALLAERESTLTWLKLNCVALAALLVSILIYSVNQDHKIDFVNETNGDLIAEENQQEAEVKKDIEDELKESASTSSSLSSSGEGSNGSEINLMIINDDHDDSIVVVAPIDDYKEMLERIWAQVMIAIPHNPLKNQNTLRRKRNLKKKALIQAHEKKLRQQRNKSY